LRGYSLFAVEESVIKDLLQLFTFELLKRLCAICLRKRRKLSDFGQESSSLLEENTPREQTECKGIMLKTNCPILSLFYRI